MGTENFKRVKIGVGQKPEGWDLASYVLAYFNKEDRKKVEEVMEKTAEAVELIVNDEFDKASNRYN